MSPFYIAIGLVMIGALVLVAALISTRRKRETSEHRLGLLSATIAQAAGQEPAPAVKPDLFASLNVPLVRLFSFGTSRSWGVHTPGATLLGVGVACALAALLLGRLLFGIPPIFCLPLMAVAFYVPPWLMVRMEEERVEAKFVDLFPDAIDVVIRMLRAGLPVTAAIRVVASESPAPVGGVFTALADQILIGKPVPDALSEMAERISLPDVRFFSVAVALQQGTGGNLASTLEILSEIIRKRRAMRLKARAVTAEVRLSSYVLGAIPVIVILGFWLLDRPYLQVLLSDRRGNFILLLAAVMLAGGFTIMRQMMRTATRV